MAKTLGLDIGTDVVRGVLLRTAIRSSEVLRYVEARLPTDATSRSGALQEAARELISALGAPPDGVIVQVPGIDVSLRVVELPAGAARRIAEVLPFELENLIPFAADETVIDYQPIDKTGSKVRIIAAAAPKARIGRMLTELRDAGIDPSEIAVGAPALDGLVAVVPTLSRPEPVLVVDIAAEDTNICFLKSGTADFARTLSVGYASPGTPGPLVSRGVQQTIAAYQASGGGQPIVCYVSGDSRAIEVVGPWLTSELGITVEGLPMPNAPGADPAVLSGFGRALALAGRAATRGKRLDLRRGEFAAKRTMSALRQHGKLLAACMAAVLVAFGFSTYAKWAVLDDRRQALRAELGAVTEETFGEASTDVDHVQQLVSGRHTGADPLPHFDAFDALGAVSASVPPEITHDTRRLTIELGDEGHPGHLEIQGALATLVERDRIADQLRTEPCFKEIETGPVHQAVGGTGLTYQIEAVIQCPGTGRPTRIASSGDTHGAP